MNLLNLKSRIMSRVYVYYALRKLCHPLALEVAFFCASVAMIPLFVSIPHVLANTPRTFEGFFNFGLVAFRNTQFVVQAIVVFMFIAGGLMAVNLLSYIPNIFTRRNLAN